MPIISQNPIIDVASLQQPSLFYLNSGAPIFACIGNPEGVITANIYAVAIDENGNIYVKTTDNINTGWIQVGAGGGTVTGTGTPNQIAYWDGATNLNSGAGVEYLGAIGSTLSIVSQANGQSALIVQPASATPTVASVIIQNPAATDSVEIDPTANSNTDWFFYRTNAHSAIMSQVSFLATSQSMFTLNTNIGEQFIFKINNTGLANTTLSNIPSCGLIDSSSGLSGGVTILNRGAFPIRFANGGTAFTNERMRVHTTGQIGINNTAPTAQLDIISADNARIPLAAISASNSSVVVGQYTLQTNATITQPNVFQVIHSTSGLAADNFGLTQLYTLESASGALRDALQHTVFWTTAADATRTSATKLLLTLSGSSYDSFQVRPDQLFLYDGSLTNITTSGGYTYRLYLKQDSSRCTILNTVYSATAQDAPYFIGARGRGSNAVPAVVQNNDVLAVFASEGYFGTAINNRAFGSQIQMIATDTWSVLTNGSEMHFYTAPNGGSSTYVGKWDRTGCLCVNTNPTGLSANNKLLVGNSVPNTDTVAAIFALSATLTPLEVYADGASTGYIIKQYLTGDSTPRNRTIAPAGIVEHRASSTTTKFMRLNGTYDIDTSSVDNSGAAETDLHTLQIDANTLFTDGDFLEIEYAGVTANNANNKQIRLYFGGSVYFDSGAIVLTNQSWIVRVRIIRTGASAERLTIDFFTENNTFENHTNTTLAIALNANQTLKVTGQATANADITQNFSIIKKGHGI